MSLHSLQQRHQWLTAPLLVVPILVTPERWACILDRIATSLSRSLVPDTTSLGRFLGRSNLLAPMREALLGRSAPLRWLDWRIRKLFWMLTWCSVRVLLPPRRAAIPRLEKPIRLLSAPETYADFQSPRLVVPGAVPCAEKDLGTELGSQIVQLLQDMYPIVTTHQAEADSDPQRRFDAAYTLLYRLIRDAPRWHQDLVDASRAGNLLGALAVGGPFAKLLRRTSSDSNDYVIELLHFLNYPVREGLCHLGSAIHYRARGRTLVVTGVSYDGQVTIPGGPGWERIERIALAGLLTHLTVWRQGMEYHVGGLAPVPILTHNYLPPEHPLRRLLAAHLTLHATTNINTHVTLRRSGFDVTGFAFPYDVILRYYNDGASDFDIRRLDVELDTNERGIPDSLDYPYLPQALRYYRLFEGYVRSYLDCYYASEETLAADRDARLWFEALDAHIVRGIRTYVPELTRQNLTKLCTLLIYSLSVAHTENSLQNYAVFMPTTVRQDGSQQSVGEVQNIVNFQLVIATPTSHLLSDISYLALDRRAAGIMGRLRDDFLDLQREMEGQPSRHWQLFPKEIDMSVSS